MSDEWNQNPEKGGSPNDEREISRAPLAELVHLRIRSAANSCKIFEKGG